MNKYSYRMVSAFLGILCLGVPALAQETQPHKPARPSFFTSKVEPGQFTITTEKKDGFVVIEMYDVSLEPVLQAVAKLAHRQLLISDEAKEELKTDTAATYKLKAPTIESAFTALTSGFSVGTLGKDTYLLVVREKSAAEIAAQKEALAKLMEKVQGTQPQQPKTYRDDPQVVPMGGRLYLLPAPLNTQQNQ